MRPNKDPQDLIDYYLEQAALCREEASRTTLANQLERLRLAEERWLELVATQRNIQAARERRRGKAAGDETAS